MIKNKPKDLKCGNCGNEWEYNGSQEFYATCTRCLRKVKILDTDSRSSTHPGGKR